MGIVQRGRNGRTSTTWPAIALLALSTAGAHSSGAQPLGAERLFEGVEIGQVRQWDANLQWPTVYEIGGDVSDLSEPVYLDFCLPDSTRGDAFCEPAQGGGKSGLVEGRYSSRSDAFGSRGTALLGAELNLDPEGTHSSGLAQGVIAHWDEFQTNESEVPFTLNGEIRLEADERGVNYPDINGQVSFHLAIWNNLTATPVETLGSACMALSSFTERGTPANVRSEFFFIKGTLPANMADNFQSVILYWRVRTTRTDNINALAENRALGQNKGGVIWQLNLGPAIFLNGFESGGLEHWSLKPENELVNDCDPLTGFDDLLR